MWQQTEFQKECSRLLRELLEAHNVNVNRWEFTQGKGEAYFEIDFDSVEVWIYEDEAQLRRDTFERRYESADYRSGRELIDVFIEQVTVLIQSSKKST